MHHVMLKNGSQQQDLDHEDAPPIPPQLPACFSVILSLAADANTISIVKGAWQKVRMCTNVHKNITNLKSRAQVVCK